jgi:pimeloyl-ACP methyl ester carboxylesterase
MKATALLAMARRPVDLLGFSLGGFVAQVIAADHPHLVRRLILAGTGPEAGRAFIERQARRATDENRASLCDGKQGPRKSMVLPHPG